jgi:5'-AMP-activated protein kinase catalytic alpha subunit
MVAGKAYNGLAVDIWSCGIILYALLCGYLPFEDDNTSKLYKKIIKGQYSVPRHASEAARDLLQGILNTDPEQRFGLE